MSTLVASAVVATAMLSHCSWNSPGRNPYRGSISEAVSRYVDIPAPVRKELIAKMQGGHADDTAAIMRDSIAGKYDYSPEITGMHFGRRTVCETVTRAGWADTAREPAKVYCVGDHCLIVPQVCGNISRVRRAAAAAAGGGGGGTGAAAAPVALAMPRAAEPALVRAASPDEVAMADAMAQMASPDNTVLASGSAFVSPFGSASYGSSLGGRNPGMGSDLTQPSPVPEPATFGMLCGGLVFVYGMVRLRASRRKSDKEK